MTIQASTCPRCAAPLDDATGLCPRCLLREALGGREAPPADPEVRQRIGDYELLDRIAQGGMGVVFKARQISVGRTVALKMILGGVLATEAEVQRFAAEAEAAANLDHPNIVPIYEIGAHQGRHFYTMKFVEGGDLSARMDDYRDPVRAARLIATCARAVHHGHRRGVLHRDLKPANILLDVDAVPHVTDFGVAKRIEADAIGSGTLTGTLLGTPAYMAPEQAAGKVRDVTTAADVYSLGAILFHLVTGRTPFVADSLAEQLRLVTETLPPRPRTLDRKIPGDLETILLKCLEKDRRQRYTSAGELADELERFAAGDPIQARPLGRVGRVGRWLRRHPATAAVSVLLAVALVTVTTAALLVAREAERARLEEILGGNAYTARAVGGVVQRQIEVFSRAVSESAADARFRAALAGGDAETLRRHVRDALERHNRAGTAWRSTPEAREPFTSWFAVGPGGVMLAHAPMTRQAGEDFSQRDYFRGARPLPDGQPYVSRLYKSVTDHRYKIAIAVPVRDGPSRLLGMLVASIAIDSEFGELQLDDDVRKVALVAPADVQSSARAAPAGPTSRTTGVASATMDVALGTTGAASATSDAAPGSTDAASNTTDAAAVRTDAASNMTDAAAGTTADASNMTDAASGESLVFLRHPRYTRQSEAHPATSGKLLAFASAASGASGSAVSGTAGTASAGSLVSGSAASARIDAATDVPADAATDAHYHDPLFDGERFLASFARVPGTRIVVVVQQRYADAVRGGVEPARRIVLWGGAALALAGVSLTVLLLRRR